MASLLDDFVVYGRPKRHPSNVRFAFLAQTRPSQTKTSCSAVMWQRWLWNTWGPSAESFDDRVGNIKARLPAPLESNKCFRARKAKNETGVNPLDLVHNLLFFWKSSNIANFFSSSPRTTVCAAKLHNIQPIFWFAAHWMHRRIRRWPAADVPAGVGWGARPETD